MTEVTAPVLPPFYAMEAYAPIINRVAPKHLNSECLHFTEHSRPHFIKILDYFNHETYERAGVMRGEYVLVDGLILMTRDGELIKANMAEEDKWGGYDFTDRYCNTETFTQFKEQALKDWDASPVVDSPIVVSHLYPNNYFHWTLETVSKHRFFKDHPNHPLLVSPQNMQSLFQRDLLIRTSPGRNILKRDSYAVRVRDPLLSHEMMCENGMHWIRETMNIPMNGSGNRRIYLRRPLGVKRERAGGGISETEQFMAFLKEHQFETIDFSGQELTVEQQVRMLDNAAVILAPHGGALTNLLYLNPPLSIIEVIGYKTPRAMFLHIASTLKLHYYGAYSRFLDDDDNIIASTDELHDIMRACVL